MDGRWTGVKIYNSFWPFGRAGPIPKRNCSPPEQPMAPGATAEVRGLGEWWKDFSHRFYVPTHVIHPGEAGSGGGAFHITYTSLKVKSSKPIPEIQRDLKKDDSSVSGAST